jgi:hypothetical protein
MIQKRLYVQTVLNLMNMRVKGLSIADLERINLIAKNALFIVINRI